MGHNSLDTLWEIVLHLVSGFDHVAPAWGTILWIPFAKLCPIWVQALSMLALSCLKSEPKWGTILWAPFAKLPHLGSGFEHVALVLLKV